MLVSSETRTLPFSVSGQKFHQKGFFADEMSFALKHVRSGICSSRSFIQNFLSYRAIESLQGRPVSVGVPCLVHQDTYIFLCSEMNG